MWKRAILAILIFALALMLVVVIRTMRLQSAAREVPAVAAVTLDDAGAVQRFVGAIQIPTESSYGQPPDADQTDAGFYTVLTPNVYRFLALDADPTTLAMIHGLNERVAPGKYLKTVRFTVQLIENIR
jgi:acetylornithine deacetylase/succinyl-diaminopimelate desuccinylase-like protein